MVIGLNKLVKDTQCAVLTHVGWNFIWYYSCCPESFTSSNSISLRPGLTSGPTPLTALSGMKFFIEFAIEYHVSLIKKEPMA